MTPFQYLERKPESVPHWLRDFNKDDTFSRDHFFASRVVYYPGSRFDGQPVKLFGSANSAHCFVYVDYGVNQAALETELANATDGFRGYHTFARVQFSENDLSPGKWQPHVESGYRPPHGKPHINTNPFGFLEVLERDHNLDDNHGPSRLGIIFLGADGIAAYDALFCQRNGTPPPFAVVLQDHGFGGNYDQFGQGGLLERIAKSCAVFPQLLLVATQNTKAWTGFERIRGVNDPVEMNPRIRNLFQREI